MARSIRVGGLPAADSEPRREVDSMVVDSIAAHSTAADSMEEGSEDSMEGVEWEDTDGKIRK